MKPRAQGAIRRGSWTWVPLVFIFYALLYDNSTSAPTAAGAEWTQLMQLPREIRMVEVVLVFLAIVVLMDRRLSRLSRRLLAAAILFTALAVGSYIAHPLVSLIDVFRLIYTYILPLLIFIIGREARLNERSRELIWRFMLAWIIISACVAWYQFMWLGYPLGDDITGLNKDAHANGNLLFFASIILTARALFLKKRKLFVGVIALIITAVLSSVLKSEIFMFLALGLVVWVNISTQTVTGRKMKAGFRRRIVPITATLVLIYIMGLAFSDLDKFNNARAGDVITRIVSEPLNFGPIASHLRALAQATSTPRSVLLGEGPFSYANPVSVGQGLNAGALGKFANASLLLQYGESSESLKVTLTSGVLAELGLPAFLILIAAYIYIGWTLWRQRNSTDPIQVAYATGLTSCWLILILTAIVTLSGSLDTISISWPVMFLAGLTCRIGAVNEQSERQSQVASP